MGTEKAQSRTFAAHVVCANGHHAVLTEEALDAVAAGERGVETRGQGHTTVSSESSEQRVPSTDANPPRLSSGP